MDIRWSNIQPAIKKIFFTGIFFDSSFTHSFGFICNDSKPVSLFCSGYHHDELQNRIFRIPSQLSYSSLTPYSGIFLRMGSANERRRYIVTSSLIGWAHTHSVVNKNHHTVVWVLLLWRVPLSFSAGADACSVSPWRGKPTVTGSADPYLIKCRLHGSSALKSCDSVACLTTFQGQSDYCQPLNKSKNIDDYSFHRLYHHSSILQKIETIAVLSHEFFGFNAIVFWQFV